MKKVLLLALMGLLFSGCSNFITQSQPTPQRSTPSPLSSGEPILDGNIYNLLVTQSNFGIDEISVTEGDTLILSVRNQLQEPINVVIDELRVKSPDIAFGQVVEVTIPTDEPGEYEMYSSLGTQQEDGFSALVIIDEKVEEEG